MRLGLILIAILVSSVANAQGCKKASFEGRVEGGESYRFNMTPDLKVSLEPLKSNWGWQVTVSPKDSTDDWTFPVNMPLRTGESQLLGTGYGTTARERLKFGAEVKFVLTTADYARYSKLAAETLESSRPEAAGEYIRLLPKIPAGVIAINVQEYDQTGSPETVAWMRFKGSIVVPESFDQGGDTRWVSVPCGKGSD